MPKQPRGTKPKSKSTASLGFEAKLWLTADKLRNKGEGDYAGANPEDPDEYKAENVLWVAASGSGGTFFQIAA